jgi:hypothetical protein
MAEADAPRPDDVADAATSTPAEAERQPVAPVGNDLDNYLEEYQAATSRPATQPEQQPTDQSSPAPQASGDELDRLLDELSRPAGPAPSGLFGPRYEGDLQQALEQQQQDLQSRLAVTQSENQQLRGFVEHQRAVRDFNRLVTETQKMLPDHLPTDYAETQLLAAAVNNPVLQQAFDFRNVDRRAVDRELRQVETVLAHFQRNPSAAAPGQVEQLTQHSFRLGLVLNSKEILRRATHDIVKRGRSHTQIDEQATADHDAVAASVRGASGKAQPEPPPNFGAMSDAELRKYTKQNFGF